MKNLSDFRAVVRRELFTHPVITENPYTAWFARGEADEEQVAELILQFSVFSNHFLVLQAKRMVNAGTLEGESCARNILMNECGVGLDPRTGSVEGRTFASGNAHLNWLRAAVSKSVALLERSIGRPLFTRTRRLVQLTQAGERLKIHAEGVYDLIEAARLDMRGEAGSPAMLKIGSREMITNYLLGPSLLAFRRKHPATRFGVYELGPREMAQALRKDQIDFAFYYSAEISEPSLEIRPLGKLSSHIYAAPSLWEGRRAPRDFDEVRRLPFIAPRYFGADPAEPSVDGFPDQQSPRHIQYEGEFLETHRRYVLDGIAAAVLPDFVIKREWRAGQVARLPGPPLGREIYFLRRRGRPLPETVNAFVETVARSIKRVAY